MCSDVKVVRSLFDLSREKVLKTENRPVTTTFPSHPGPGSFGTRRMECQAAWSSSGEGVDLKDGGSPGQHKECLFFPTGFLFFPPLILM